MDEGLSGREVKWKFRKAISRFSKLPLNLNILFTNLVETDLDISNKYCRDKPFGDKSFKYKNIKTS